METYYAVCAGILTLTHLIGVVILIVTLIQVRRAAESVEVLAYRAQDQVSKVEDATDKLRTFAGTLRVGWVQTLAAALGVAGSVWSRRKPAPVFEHDDREKKGG